MDEVSLDNYNKIRSGGTGFYEQKRGLISVWGSEAVQFLDGLITNDVKTLEDGAQMLAAFPNAQGRLLAVARVMRQGGKFLFETEEATRAKVFNNLFRFTYAGDFFVEDLSENYRFFDVFSDKANSSTADFDSQFQATITIGTKFGTEYFVIKETADIFLRDLIDNGAVEISDDLYEVLRIENGVPKYGVDMDETTIVPELGIEGLISYNKGCYIGQEIIARIHFRGHVAKKLTGLISDSPPYKGGVAAFRGRGGSSGLATTPVGGSPDLSEPGAVATGFLTGAELKSPDGKNAGKITSATFSPKLGKTIALGYVRYDYLAEGTELIADDFAAKVYSLPFLK